MQGKQPYSQQRDGNVQVARTINLSVLDDTFADLLPDLDSAPARVIMLAIGLQESRLIHRAQIIAGGGKGPARGLWQFERAGGVAGVLSHRVTRDYAAAVCELRGVDPNPRAVWPKLEFDDLLAAAFARLLLWTDSRPLPRIGDSDAAWTYYERNWRPGKPHPRTWPGLYAAAMGAVA